jgi:predicted nucleotidyltransferase
VSDLTEGLVPESWMIGVFGSSARCERRGGRCREVSDGSDVDLLIIYPDNHSIEALNARRAVAGEFRKISIAVDIVLLSESENEASRFWITEDVREVRECLV